MAYKQINLNPEQKRVGDCTVRAIAAATHQEWATVYAALVLAGLELYTMLLVIKNIAVYCYIILFYHILFLLFHTFKKKSVYF